MIEFEILNKIDTERKLIILYSIVFILNIACAIMQLMKDNMFIGILWIIASVLWGISLILRIFSYKDLIDIYNILIKK